MRRLAVLVVALTSQIACFDLWPSSPCDAGCSTQALSPNAKWPICYPDGTCRDCREDRDCRTACGSDGFCRPCGPEAPCEGHAACVEGVCEPCTESGQCAADETCVQGRCGTSCTEDRDCEAFFDLLFDSLHSTPARGAWFGCTFRAQANLLCSGDGYYPDRLVCAPCVDVTRGGACPLCSDSGDCPCASPTDCEPGSGCKGGVCGHCTADDQCRPGEVCSEGTCRPACASEEDCPGGRCATESGRCAECLVDDDCPSDERCYRDGCVRPCTSDEACFPTECTPNGRCSLCDRPPPT